MSNYIRERRHAAAREKEFKDREQNGQGDERTESRQRKLK
jgi:hypothetical protein